LNLKPIAPEHISKHAKLFLTAAVLNGIGNGIFGVVMQLYFAGRGIGSSTLGSILLMNALGAAILTIPVGILADRYGKKKMIALGMISVLTSIGLILFGNNVLPYKLGFFAIGISNAAGVVLSPIYSSFFSDEDMDKAFGLYGAINIVTVAAGSLLGFIPPLMVDRYGLTLQTSYWAFMALGAAFFLLQYVFYFDSLKGYEDASNGRGFNFNLESKDLIVKISLVQALSAVAFGVFFSLFPFYVNKKFGLESDALGALFFASYFFSAGAQAISPRISQRFGSFKTITLAYALATPFYLLIPLAPDFGWLSVLYIARLSLVNLVQPLLGSSLMKGLKEEEKATANSIRMMSMQCGGVIGPWLGGVIMERASLELPAYIGGSLYALLSLSLFIITIGKETIQKNTPVVETPLEESLQGDYGLPLDSDE
jgi:MFS family permease